MIKKEKRFNTRRFVSVMTLCMFLVTGISGMVLLLSHGHPAPGSSGVLFKWMGMHEIGCVFFLIFGIWHLVLNFKIMLRYFTGTNNRKIDFRLDWGIPVIITIFLFVMLYLVPAERHEYQDYRSLEYSKGFNDH